MWRDIAFANKTMVKDALEHFLTVISHMRAELESGAEHGEQTEYTETAAYSLFPRVLASALVSAVQLCERRHELKLVRYAGAGFADIAAPAMEPPEEDMEAISKAYGQVAGLLKAFEDRFRTMFIALINDEDVALESLMTAAQEQYLGLSRE
jgi:prephenate dehydrogenase